MVQSVVGIIKPISFVIFSIFHHCQNTGFIWNATTFIFDRCHRNWVAATPVKYESDSKNLTGTFARSKISLADKSTNGALVTPTTDLGASLRIPALTMNGTRGSAVPVLLSCLLWSACRLKCLIDVISLRQSTNWTQRAWDSVDDENHVITFLTSNQETTLYCSKESPEDIRALHYNDVIMSAMALQITSLTIVYPTVYSRRR